MWSRGWLVLTVGIGAIFLHHVFVSHSRRTEHEKTNGGEEMEPENQDEVGYAKKPKKRSQNTELMDTGPLEPPPDPPGGNAKNLAVSAFTEQHTKVINPFSLQESSLHQKQIHGHLPSSEDYDLCVHHSVDHEYNFFHMFERNLLSVSHSIFEHRKRSSSEKIALIYEECVICNNIEKWSKALLDVDVFSWTTNPKSESPKEPPTISCKNTVSSMSCSWNCISGIRTAMYQRYHLDDTKDDGGPPVLCFLSRDNKKRLRNIKNREELTKKAETMGYTVIDLIFDHVADVGDQGVTPGFIEPKLAVQRMSQCDAAIGIHGATLTNWAFMRPGSIAVQVVPYGLSNGFIASYQTIATKVGLRYSQWDAPQASSFPDWSQLEWSNNELKSAVCDYGVEQLKQDGNQGNDFLSWAFWVNQEVNVPVDIFTSWLSSKPQAGLKVSQGAFLAVDDHTNPASINLNKYIHFFMQHRSLPSASDSGAFDSHVETKLKTLQARVKQLAEDLKRMTSKEAKQFCAEYGKDKVH